VAPWIQASLAATGASVGSHDLLIGARAIALGYRAATRDRQSFGKIPGLEVLGTLPSPRKSGRAGWMTDPPKGGFVHFLSIGPGRAFGEGP
jgi:hypothetical protein